MNLERLGFLTPFGLVVGALALLAVAGVGLATSGQIFSPGPLSTANPTGVVLGGVRSHAELQTQCAACHPAPWSVQRTADRCLTCHTSVRAQLTDPATLHGSLAAQRCRDCHTEHNGPKASLIRVKSLVVNHDRFGFSLAVHQTTAQARPFNCADCHTQSLARFDAGKCESCHANDQPEVTFTHIGQFGRDCRACHDGVDRYGKNRFDHGQTTYPLTGKHVGVPCVQCHAKVVDPAGFKNAPSDCSSCHRKVEPHRGAYGADCARCHTADDWKKSTFNHNQPVFKAQACVDCHLQDDTHHLARGADCGQCHTTQDWKKTTFDHSRTAFQLTGKHAVLACAQCHVNNVYKGTPQACLSCHAQSDVHQGLFGTDCGACHTTDTWQGGYLHTFPLDHGGRGVIACATCHTTPGNYKAFTCSTCHDPLDMQRKHFMVRVGPDTPPTECIRCHPKGRITMTMH